MVSGAKVDGAVPVVVGLLEEAGGGSEGHLMGFECVGAWSFTAAAELVCWPRWLRWLGDVEACASVVVDEESVGVIAECAKVVHGERK